MITFEFFQKRDYYGEDKITFLDEHLIPDALEEKDIADFFDKRKTLLVEKLQNALK